MADTDIPESMAEAARQSQAFLQTVIDAIPDALLVIGQDFRISLANRAARELVAEQDPTCLTCHQLSHRRDLPCEGWNEPCPLREVIATRAPVTVVHTHYNAEGQEIFVEVNAAPVFNDAGEVTHLIETCRDITARKRMEERVAQLSSLKERLLGPNTLPEKLKLITEGVVEVFGAEFARIWMVNEGDLCGRDCRYAVVTEGPDVCHDRSRCLHLAASSGRYTMLHGSHRRVPLGCYKIGRIASGEERKLVTNDVTHDPRVHDHEWAKSLNLIGFAGYRLLSSRGTPLGVLALFSKREIDANDDALLEDLANTTAQVIRAGEAETAAAEANRAKEQFLANVSHELRTPMNAILGMVELALGEELPPTVRDHLQTVQSSAEVLLLLLNEILDLSRIEAGKFTVETVPFSLRNILDATMEVLAADARTRGLNLVCTTASQVPDRLIGDPLRLRQVLTNLVGNALKFTERGEVAVRVAVESQTPEEAVLRFSVSDTGIGISPEQQEKIFAPFVQADASTTRQFGGAGLGLAIASSLVGMMGGRLWVDSELGRGSTFSFTARLRLQPAALDAMADRPAPPSAECPARRSLHILLAEDATPNQKLVASFLGKRGHTVLVAENGREAVALARQHDFDLVLMDVQMPGMDGYQATAAIRALPDAAKARLPIVAMTACARKRDQQQCLAAGMNACLTKPLHSSLLIETIERLAEGFDQGQAGRSSAAIAGPNLDDTAPQVATEEVFNLEESLATLGGQHGLFQEMVAFFFLESPRLLAEIQMGLKAHDAPKIARAAHRLKSTLVYLGAGPAVAAAGHVEEIADSSDLTTAAEAGQQLDHEMGRLQQALSQYHRQQKV